MKLKEIIYKIYDSGLRVLYPQTCYFCGKINKTPVCYRCKGKLVYAKEPCCKKCGKPVRYDETEFCEDCKSGLTYFDQGRSLWLHKPPVTWSVYQYKYHNRRVFGAFYAKELWKVYGKQIKEWDADVIVPVPIHWRRRRERGFNQAEILARHLGIYANIPVKSKVISRVRFTKRQKELDNKGRKKNLEGAFRVKDDWNPVKTVLIVDDIYTTGNTINEMAKVLKKQGVEKVVFLTISIGQGF